MRSLPLLVIVCLLVGCTATRIDRDTFNSLYQETALREGVLSVVPLHERDPDSPPTIVNWWYTGTSNGYHRLICRQLTWDQTGQPVGQEFRYRIAQNELVIQGIFPRTTDARQWVPLYEAAADVPLPSDLPTQRQRHGTAGPEPVEPDEIEPDSIKPDSINPLAQ